MSRLPIDLTGKGGLAPRFFGDIDRTSATPHLRYEGADNQMADGIYNPFRRHGYLSAANATFASMGVGATMYTTLGGSVTWQTCAVAITPAVAATAPVVNSASVSNDDTSDTTHTLSFTVGSSLSNSMLIVAVTHETGSAVPSGVTYNGEAMTLSTSGTAGGYVSIWYKMAPTSGTHDIVATWAVNTAEKAIHAILLTGASGVNVGGSNNGTSTLASVTIQPSTHNCLLVMATGSANATHAPGTYQTEQTDQASGTTPFRYSTSTRSMAMSAVLGSSLYDRENDDYYFAERGEIVYFGSNLDDDVVTSVLDLGATGTPVIHDMEIYQVNGVRKMFVAYETGGNVEVAMSALPYDQTADTVGWLSTTPTNPLSGQAITGDSMLRVADNGFMYLLMDNQVHKIDGTTNGGTNGTVSANVLVFPAYFRIVDAIDYRGLMFIAIHQYSSAIRASSDTATVRNQSVGVYIWDRQSTVVQTRDYIPVEGIKEIRRLYVSPSGSVRLIGTTSENVVVICEYNGSTFQQTQEVGFNAHPVYVDSLTNIGLSTVWLGNDGIFYAHGKITPQDQEALYKIGKLTDINSGTSAGAILFGGSNTDSGTAGYKTYKSGLFLGYFSTSYRQIKEWDIYGTGSAGYTALQHQGDVFTLVKYLPSMSVVNYLDIYFPQISTSGSTTAATIKIYFNQSSTAWASKTITYDDLAKGYINIQIQKPYINAIQLEIEWAGLSLPAGNDFSPSFAILDYKASTDIG